MTVAEDVTIRVDITRIVGTTRVRRFNSAGFIHYRIITIIHITIHSNVYGTVFISRAQRAVGVCDIGAITAVEVTGRSHVPSVVETKRVRRAKNEDRFYPILILNLLLYTACIIHHSIPHHLQNLQHNASFP